MASAVLTKEQRERARKSREVQLQRQKEIQEGITNRTLSQCPQEGKWSGKLPIPAIGSTVEVRVNGIGASEVLGYWLEYGWIGLVVIPQNPPDWYEYQNGKNGKCVVFGAELKQE